MDTQSDTRAFAKQKRSVRMKMKSSSPTRALAKGKEETLVSSTISRLFKRVIKKPFISFGIIISILFGITTLVLGLFSDDHDSFSTPINLSSLNQDEQMFLSPSVALIESPGLLLFQENSLRAASPVNVFSPQVLAVLIGASPEPVGIRRVIVEHIVQPGDSLWSIAIKFDISTETLIWANELEGTIIRPGQTLLVLPVSGVKHIVQTGETTGEIAKNYNVVPEEVIAFNNLSPDGEIFVGQSLIIPGGTKPLVRPIDRAVETLAPSEIYARFSTNNFFAQSHPFPFGQCTWWVAQRRAIPAWGHAKSWLPNARAAGFQTCRGRYCLPVVGAVIIVRGDPVFGHVGYVERVRGTEVTFSEMNNIGWGRVNERTLRIGNSAIIGYIY